MRRRRARTQAIDEPVALPTTADTVTLSTGAGGRIPARVLECSPDSLLVALMVPTKPFSASELEGLVLEFAGPRGRVRLSGSARVESAHEPDLLRIDSPRSLEVIQQREYVRIRAARPVLVYGADARLDMQSYTVDVSGGGFLLAGPDTLRVGERLDFRLTLAQGSAPVTGRGHVVRADPRGQLAVAFEQISDLDRRRLVRFIFECQRDERRRGLQLDDGYGS
jgi:PilZ domain-containing protein